ncbi:ABC transporter ATP-binding protein [Nocardioides sp. Soil796]|uniref:ABC transporter ATP-binding protein n=1 Tax=Nocardioides sp. Soil796 TaxID=1736412 RepID=UPI00070B788D|nr:ABC transporter ATP-binding protein [Nocardioides sp. Soil796]KRF10395.1 hypothetical protein ASH02_19985 [Nocardioides sp. Soil796]
MTSQINFSGVSHRYGKGVLATEDVNLDIAAGEFVALIGPSGCGKTTLLNMVAGLVSPSDGAVSLNGEIVSKVPENLGYMMARDALLPWRTALGNVEFSLEGTSISRKEHADRARTVLGQVGLGGFEGHYPAQLSQGMRQRVAIARTLVTSPSLILMDEPFAALDAQTRVLIHEEFLNLWEQAQATVIMVTHDLTEAILLADRVVIMSARPGRIKDDIRVPLSRPRDVEAMQTSPEFQEIYSQLWGSLREEFHAGALIPEGAK